MPSFAGFSEPTFSFLRDLAADNRTDWFKAKENQKRYKTHVVAPAKAFVVALDDALADLGDFRAVPSANGSLGRINRDIRFSKDKTPYNTHLAFHFWLGEGSKKESAGFRVWVGLDGMTVGAGARGLTDLDALRAAIADEGRGAALLDAVAHAEADGYTLHGDAYKRVPKPYAKDHPRAELLKFKSMYVGKSEPVPAAVATPAFVDHVAAGIRSTLPVARWLQAVLEG